MEPLDAQDLVKAIEVTRGELADLLGGRFVQAGSEETIEIRSERRTPESIQNDIERVHGLSQSSLDRLHRFTRLWRATGWTVRELDLTLAHLAGIVDEGAGGSGDVGEPGAGGHGPVQPGHGHIGLAADIDAAALRSIVDVRDLAKRFRLDVEDTTVLYGTLPTTPITEGRAALFSRLFNLADFVTFDGTYPKTAEFVHPSLRDDPAAPAPDHAFQRLLAGLRVDADRLLQLIAGLARRLGVDPDAAAEADRGFVLSVVNLSLLFRHARLAEWLKLTVPELFRTISMSPVGTAGYVANLNQLLALLDFTDWLRASGLALDDLAYVTGQPVAPPDRYPTADGVAQRVLDRMTADNPLPFGENIFTSVDGVSDTDSRDILRANASSVVRNDNGLYRLADDFDPEAVLTVPAAVRAPEPALRALLVARHASRVVATYLASELHVDVPKAQALLVLSGVDLSDPGLQKALRGAGAPTPLEDIVKRVLRLAVLLQGDEFDAVTIEFIRSRRGLFGLTDVSAPTLDTLRKLDVYRRLATADGQRKTDLATVIGAFHESDGFKDADPEALARVLEVGVAVASSLQAHLTLPSTAPESLTTLQRAARLAAFLGVDGGTLMDIADNSYGRLVAAANAVLAAFRAKYPDEKKWHEQVDPIEGRILNKRRDGLCEFLVHAFPQFQTHTDLYRYFLVDVDVDACFTSSRVVAATGSLQLYVHRVLMNLEQDQAGQVHVPPNLVPAAEWDWRKHYRVWEANRKVFLWPENYLFPDLRDDKTPLFAAIERDLLQKELHEQSALDAYTSYLEGFQELAFLRIAGSYHDIDPEKQSDVLHLFGVTAGDPPTYYYRRVENARFGETVDSKGVVWGPWLQVDVKIPVRQVAPVVHNGQLRLLWVEIVSTPQNDVTDGKSRFVGYAHKLSLKYSTLRLDGRWSAPQKARLSGPHPFAEGDGVIDDPLAEPAEWAQFMAAFANIMCLGAFGNLDAANSLPAAQRKLLTPRYDTQMHTKARDGYTLTGMEWEQVYPEAKGSYLMVHGAGYQMYAGLDLFTRTSREAADRVTKEISQSINSSPPSPLLGVEMRRLWAGAPSGSVRWDDYAYAALVADADRFNRVLKDWSTSDRDAVSAGVWTTMIARVGLGTLAPINGSVSDGILDVNGDLYLIQSSVRAGACWLLKRLGTTLAETVSRALFTRGVDGLLDYETQRTLGEAPRNVDIFPAYIEDHVVGGKVDYTGPYGVYYREIFFQIPFLVAQTLNAQGKYAEAQKWYQYLFDPTSREVVADVPGLSAAENAARKRDRNWRYREFRGLDLPTLREILTESKAIEAYRNDPFNPHAIARMRLSAYQKAVVMRYIDNLLDWADELFTQFQMESVNEAMLLYATAADILGDRPAVLGECGADEVTPKSYEKIKPFLGRGSEFLTELEHWTYVNHQRAYTGTKRTNGLTVDVAKAAGANDRIYTLARVKDAGILSTEAKRRIVIRGDDVIDIEDTAAILTNRLENTDGTPIGSIDDAVVTARSTIPAATTVAGGAGAATAVAGQDTEAEAAPFTGGLTRSTRWQELTVLGSESRYVSAADHRVRDLVAHADSVHLAFVRSLVRQISPVFCVPQNKDLISYWDRLEDRLYKLRNCMDITGARRTLSLFAPEIDPMMLVRARAAGLSLDDVLDAIGGDLPPYRFTYLLDKAKTFAATVQSYGSALLGALERKDGEELNELREVHQQQLLALTTDVRRWEYDTAVNAVEELQKRRESLEHRLAYCQQLLDGGLNAEEWTERITRHISTGLRTAEATLDFVAGVTHLIPQLGSPFAMKYGGQELGTSAANFAGALRTLADVADLASASAVMEATFSRREQIWRRDLQGADDDLAEIDKQIRGAELRRQIAERATSLHEKTVEQTNEVYQMYRDRFTGVGLYSWLSTETQRLYREAYNATYALARLAERAYRFERDDDSTVSLQASYWDASKAGLRAGERLLIDLQRLEQRFLETNYRAFEINQSFSLLQLSPTALVQLRETGLCEFNIPEIAFDIVYPGHYRRRIRCVRLTIPSITGPCTNVSATLRLLENRVRREPDLGDESLIQLPLPRTSTIATSSAQNDGGVFEMSFRDERYMPFEGAGAVSRWQLELPASFRQFDYQTISDVILSIGYTALEDGGLRQTVAGLNASVEGAILNVLENEPMGRLFSLRQDFSTAFSRLVHSPTGTSVTIEITDKHFSAFLVGRDLDIASATLLVRAVHADPAGTLKVKLNGTSVTGFASDVSFGGLPAKSVSVAFPAGILGEHTIEIEDGGGLDLDPAEPGDDSALDDHKIADIMLYVEVRVG